MVWAGIWHGSRTAAVTIRGTLNSERYKNEIVLPFVIPTVQERHLIFQDDNATSHCAGTVVRAAVRDSGIPTLPWPARSPDLSPIEHAWDELGRRVRSTYPHSPSTLPVDELSQRLCEQ